MAQLAIRGHATRGREVIELLEMLGGINKYNLRGSEDEWFVLNGTLIQRSDRLFAEKGFPLEEFLEKFPYKVGDKVQHKGATSCGSIYEVETMRWEEDTIKYTLNLFGCNYKTYTLPSEYLQPYKEETMEDNKNFILTGKINTVIFQEQNYEDKVELDLGDYEIKVEDGKTYVVRKKPQYPKSYKECCDVLGLCTMDNDAKGYKSMLIIRFQELLIARDAYWKIVGDWKYDVNKTEEYFYIVNKCGRIVKEHYMNFNHILAFPTEEMRDAFYENFKDLINETKELL